MLITGHRTLFLQYFQTLPLRILSLAVLLLMPCVGIAPAEAASSAASKAPFSHGNFVIKTPMPTAPYRSTSPTLLVVDTRTHFTHVLQLQGSKVVRAYSFSNAIGSEDHPTPPGRYTIVRKLKWPSWIPPKTIDPKQKAIHPYNKDRKNPLGVAALYLDREELMLHGTNNPKSIRKDVSHGCVRHSNSDISKLYGMVRPGTVVYITSRFNGQVVRQKDFGSRK